MKKYPMLLVAAVWLALAVWCWVRPKDAVSAWERRELAQFPAVSAQSFLEGEFPDRFDKYAQDQFPLRNGFRSLKAQFHRNILRQQDNHGIYLSQGQAAKIEYPMSAESVTHAARVMESIREKYLADSKVYLAIVPDKNYYLAAQGGYPAMDYEELVALVGEGLQDETYVNLFGTLGPDDYYTTDTHWRQERLLPTAAQLCQAMGLPAPGDFTVTTVEEPFYGVYYGQAALSMPPDTLCWLENETLAACRVYNYETGQWGGLYDESKLAGEDLYETFLSGPVSLLRIENPNAQTDRELILFRDSFGSSLAPLLVHGYQSVTLVDVRYVNSAMLDRFLEFKGQDVLFLYSTLVLNNSSQMQ